MGLVRLLRSVPCVRPTRCGQLAAMFRLVTSGSPPSLVLPAELQFHLFLSHVWSTAQDQNALIKRRLQAVMPGVRVFLDGASSVNSIPRPLGASRLCLLARVAYVLPTCHQNGRWVVAPCGSGRSRGLQRHRPAHRAGELTPHATHAGSDVPRALSLRPLLLTLPTHAAHD